MMSRPMSSNPRSGPRHERKNRKAYQFPQASSQVSIIVTILLLTITSLSCVDLTQVTQFAKSSQDVGNTFKALSSDTAAVCGSAATFFPPGQAPLNCDRYVQLQPALAKVNDVLFAYIASLGKIACIAPPKDAFTNVGAELKQADASISQADQNNAKAAGGLADALSKIILSGYQRHELARMIHESNSSVQAVVSFLSGYAAAQSELLLNNTWTLEEEYCNSNRNQLGAAEPLAAKLLAQKCDDDKARINTKVAAVEQYQKALATIAATHDILDKKRNSLTNKELLHDIGPQTSSLSAAALAMQKALQ
jgi:hypothetical protein